MTREETKDYFSRLTGGCAARILDGALYACYVSAALVSQPRTSRGARRVVRIADDLLDRCDAATIRSWLVRLRAKGWIGERLRITREGQRRLEGLLPSIRWNRPWDGQWYLVSFDIPERLHHKRDLLRAALRRLGFGKLHSSLWISPWNVLGDAQEVVRRHHLELDGSVLVAMSPRLGTQEARALAARVWTLAEINDRYRAFARVGRGERMDPMQIGAFLAVLRDDPQLPKALLPQPWYGFDAMRSVYRSGGPLLKRVLQM